MPRSSRRQFLTRAAALAGGLALPVERVHAAPPSDGGTAPHPPRADHTPPDAITTTTIAEAEKLAAVSLTPAERAQAASSWRELMAPLAERRTGPRRVALDDAIAPAAEFHPAALVGARPPARARFVPSKGAVPPLPTRDEDIAFAPLTSLSAWLGARKLSSERLTRLYLDRLERFQPQLLCCITLLREQALADARRADEEIARGHRRGPLHGVPWGAKDLVDTAGVATTYGAELFRNRVPTTDATVVRRLREAGAVLVAKLSLGALAMNDVWFGGQTRNPWLLDEGSSGSSAGPGAATAAGLVGFALGSETCGSILSPSLRCGVAGLRPTFGRVPRTGAMTLCWSLDKLGAMCRTVEDTMLVLRALDGPDAADVGSVSAPIDFDAAAPVAGLRVGYVKAWLDDKDASPVDRAALEQLRALGLRPVEVTLPDWPWQSLMTILFAEAAAAFEEVTLTHRLAELRVQVDDAWPNSMRLARFLSAVDLVQADRLRRKTALEMARVMSQVDVLLAPVYSPMMIIGNFTGHPALAVRTGFIDIDRPRSDWSADAAHPPPKLAKPRRVPYGPSLVGRLYDEGTLARVGIALERAAGVAAERPPGF